MKLAMVSQLVLENFTLFWKALKLKKKIYLLVQVKQ